MDSRIRGRASRASARSHHSSRNLRGLGIFGVGGLLDNRWRGEARGVGVTVRASGPEPKSANPQALMPRISLERQHFEHIHIGVTGAGKTARSSEKTGTYTERCLSCLPGPSGFDKVNYPLLVASGSKHPTQYPMSCFPSHIFGASITFVRIKRTSQNSTRSRSRSNHCPQTVSPIVRPTLASASMRVKAQGTRIEICLRPQCLDEIVRSATTIHVTVSDPGRKTAPEFCRF